MVFQYYYDTKTPQSTHLYSILDYYSNPLHNRHQFHLSSFLVGPTTLDCLDHQWKTDTTLSIDSVIIPADGNPGFDVAIPVMNQHKSIDLYLIEARYSDPSSRTLINFNELQHNNARNVYLIFACYRLLQKQLIIKYDQLPSNV